MDYEVWKKVKFDGISPREDVEVSNYGRLKSYKVRPKNGKILSGSYLGKFNVVSLERADGGRKSLFVHKLVAEKFVKGKTKTKNTIIHLDHDKSNNHFENLKWVTKKEANEYRRKSPDYDKRKIRNAKLSEKDVIEIKKLLKNSSLSVSEIARKFSITHTQINRIKSGRNWTHIKL